MSSIRNNRWITSLYTILYQLNSVIIEQNLWKTQTSKIHSSIQWNSELHESLKDLETVKNTPGVITGPDGFNGEFYQTCKEEIIPM
jgi:hypothetical protein